MLTKNNLMKEFQAFNKIWGLLKRKDEVENCLPGDEKTLWNELISEARSVEAIIGDEDKAELDLFCDMTNNMLDYLEKLRRK